jgi:two-component system, sensor histidine kinase and response regulator
MDAPVNDTVSMPENLARLALEATAEGILGVDAEGIVTFANSAAGRMLGYTTVEIVGQSVRALRHRQPSGRPRQD